ncbi:hypothetical protein E2C01_077823 [Portunus trituberculatus]|uniref:Uncharacterized protein n=1 Tax=Portunus trituberculatus TaxID=210409 RepID=A0A5B7IFG4_PORTR|nr:hypothetical protein [Portunus trituberculatus]
MSHAILVAGHTCDDHCCYDNGRVQQQQQQQQHDSRRPCDASHSPLTPHFPDGRAAAATSDTSAPPQHADSHHLFLLAIAAPA